MRCSTGCTLTLRSRACPCVAKRPCATTSQFCCHGVCEERVAGGLDCLYQVKYSGAERVFLCMCTLWCRCRMEHFVVQIVLPPTPRTLKTRIRGTACVEGLGTNEGQLALRNTHLRRAGTAAGASGRLEAAAHNAVGHEVRSDYSCRIKFFLPKHPPPAPGWWVGAVHFSR